MLNAIHPVLDADLVVELETHRGSAGFEFTQRAIAARQLERDRLAGLSPSARKRHQTRPN